MPIQKVEMDIHVAKEIIGLIGVHRSLLEQLNNTPECKKTLVNNIDKMRRILIESVNLKQEEKDGRFN